MKKKTFRVISLSVLALLVVISLLVIMAPTILSTGSGKALLEKTLSGPWQARWN